MFKLESYIAPILLSYVDKYIKNFKLEDSQVSLWGGDASFQNLDLRLEVLEQELQSPFSFISGHIRELLIHVPWTKLTSEPITVTINTIECVLKLRDSNSSSSEAGSTKEKQKKANSNKEVETPPNYAQLLINKIVSNIRIYCNNLILKYVEEDIVLSMNVKHLKFESCNDKWEAAYTDVSPTHVIMRKVISVNDLTICLDKRNASGKIDVYQEPMLYRCSMTMHFLRSYQSSTAKKTSLTRIDVYCNNMEFSVTEQQVPMVLRLLLLLYALHQKQLKQSSEDAENNAGSAEAKEASDGAETWTGWAWSYVSSVLPTQWEDESDEHQFLNETGHFTHLGFYVDSASFTFKISESSDKGYYTQKKIRYVPLITLQLQGIYSEVISKGLVWTSVNCGVSEILLLPLGACSCSFPEITDEDNINPYLRMGCRSSNHKTDCLFDAEAPENKGQFRKYNTSWDYHINSITEEVLLERTPAIAFDYLYQIEIPDDSSSEILSEMGSNYEYSNFEEKSNIRICLGALKFLYCSGFAHRIDTLRVATLSYDYSPYYVEKPDLMLNELLPPSAEDFDALNEFIPYKQIRIMIYRPTIELQLMDHPLFNPMPGHLVKKSKKHSTASLPSKQPKHLNLLPKFTIECQLIEIVKSNPMYIKRLIHTTCQLPDPPKKMFDACFLKFDLNVVGFTSRLLLKQSHHTTILVPFNFNYNSKNIIKPQYWTNPDILHDEIKFQSDNLTISGTNPKLMVVSQIIRSILNRSNCLKTTINTSLLFDAAKDFGMPYLELYIEGASMRRVTTNTTVSFNVSLGSIKAFIFDATENSKIYSNDIQQILFLSGPEVRRESKSKLKFSDEILFTMTIQYPLKPELQNHPPIVIFNLEEIKICIDPLLCKWLLYSPIRIVTHEEATENIFVRMKSYSETHGTVSETSKRMSAPIESVHSSDREWVPPQQSVAKVAETDAADPQERIYTFFKTWYNVWKGMIVNGNISQCTIYFPTSTISSVGSRGVEDAIRDATEKGKLSNVLIITLPLSTFQSAQKQQIKKYLNKLPVKLPENTWTRDKSNFPWTMSISDLNCYTIQHGKKLIFLKPVSLSATVSLSTKTDLKQDSESNPNIGHLGVYVHVDMTPIIMSTCETQIYLFASILYGLTEVLRKMWPEPIVEIDKQEMLPPILTGNSPSLSPTARDNTLEDTSDNTLPASEAKSEGDNGEAIKLTAWIQWTITRFSIELLSDEFSHQRGSETDSNKSQLKLFIDVEDIVSSLDYQKVYLKLKSKIGSISIQHFKRSFGKGKWQPGPFSGVILRVREDISTEKRHEESGFISVTLTRASSQHTHNLWGAVQKHKGDKRLQPPSPPSRYITEVVVNVQPIDVVLPIRTLINFYSILVPLFDLPTSSDVDIPIETHPQSLNNWFNNLALPLAYLDCQDIRIIMPSDDLNRTGIHDVFILQVSKISLSPSVVNPICRSPLRSDIYRQAAQARILNIPGSDLEDRQYQLDIIGLCISTVTWEDLNQVLNIQNVVGGVNENPALEWNNLKQGQFSIIPILNLKQVSERFDISIVAAPAMIYKQDVVICGNSFEINFVSDITIQLSLDQIKLAAALVNELSTSETQTATSHKKDLLFPYMKFEKYSKIDEIVELEMTEFFKDSGIDTSDIKSVLSSKSIPKAPSGKKSFSHQRSGSFNFYCLIPTDMLFTGGKVSFCLYQSLVAQPMPSRNRGKKRIPFKDEDQNYEASEEESIDEVNSNQRRYVPLLFFQIAQPNAYFSKQQLSSRAQLSCFDINIKINNAEATPISSIPTAKDFPVNIVETRSGNPDVITGIPPAFLTLKYTKEIGKLSSFILQLSRPTKIVFSTPKLLSLMSLRTKIMENFNFKSRNVREEMVVTEVSQTNFRKIKEHLRGIEVLELKTDQIVLVIETDKGTEARLTIGKLRNRIFLSERPEKICNTISLDCVSFSATQESVSKILLNPWSFSIEVYAFLEPWQSSDSDPQIHIAINSDCIMLEVSTEQIQCVEHVVKELQEFTASFSFPSKEPVEETPAQSIVIEKDQYYKDDLRAGAFQFIDANTNNPEELPLPYQVVFWNKHQVVSAMAWRYPHPRTLTKVLVFPVPFEISGDGYLNQQISCNLQYWSDYQGCYINYVQFFLSESKICYLNLPKDEPERAVACVWRVVLTMIDETGNECNKISISPHALAACMRIDSYFNKSLVPNLTSLIYISKIDISMYTYFNKTSTVLPKCLAGYSSDLAIPDNHCFFKLGWENVRLSLAYWNSKTMYLDLSSVMKCSVLDYSFLNERPLFNQFTSKIQVNLSKKLTCNLISNDIQLIFGPTIAHTLAVNAQMWMQNLNPSSEQNFIIFTRYVICNDTNANLRFGQHFTDEEILLPTKSFHLYCWRSHRRERKLKIALEEKGWTWSKPFYIDFVGTHVIPVSAENNLSIIITVKSLSPTQKQIIISGQLVIANMLLEHFEFKIVPDLKGDRDKEIKKAPTHILAGKTTTPSLFLNYKLNYFMRLRFFGLESAWTGDIPLKEHIRGAQPWLVKVPLQERGQFLSIWCRIVVQDLAKNKKILAMLWPLFSVKSNLPITSNINIETPSLNVRLDSVVGGKGELQQLYCPGTIDHSHQLTFKLEYRVFVVCRVGEQ